MRDSLRLKYEQGHRKPKNSIKDEHNSTPFIHSDVTYKTYIKACDRFSDWLKENYVTDKDEAFVLVPEYLSYLEHSQKSAWTILLALNAIAKAYSVPTTAIKYQAPKRERVNAKRSRYSAKRDSHFSVENNKQLIDFCSATGLRRHELLALHGTDLIEQSDGTYKIHVIRGKGGKERYVDVIGGEKEIQNVVRIMKLAKDGIVFQHVHSDMDVHYYRSIYACRAYKKLARDISTIDKADKYMCRKDKAGVVYDKKAMKYASKMLGHNRIDVIANSYLHNL